MVCQKIEIQRSIKVGKKNMKDYIKAHLLIITQYLFKEKFKNSEQCYPDVAEDAFIINIYKEYKKQKKKKKEEKEEKNYKKR